MTLEDAIKNREDCLKYLEGLGQKASPQNVEAVRWSVRALKFMQSLTLTPPNEPLTQEDIDKMHFDRVWIDYGLDDSGERCGEDGVILYGKLYSIDTLDGSAFEDLLLNACDGETLGRPSGDYTVYRRPPEGEENA